MPYDADEENLTPASPSHSPLHLFQNSGEPRGCKSRAKERIPDSEVNSGPTLHSKTKAGIEKAERRDGSGSYTRLGIRNERQKSKRP